MSAIPVIVSACRTPIGSFRKAFQSLTAPQLGAVAIQSAVERAGIEPSQVTDVIMGNVLSAGSGQAPARQAAKGAGLPDSVCCTTVNKVCASGTKTVALAAQAIKCGDADIVVAGGMESMSNVPYYMPNLRAGTGYGNTMALDGVLHDGLTDVYNKFHMGNCAENTCKKHDITREQQDDYAIASYKRSAAAWEKGAFKNEVVPVTVKSRKGDTVVTTDEEFTNVNFDKIPKLRAAFQKENGTVTAGNASTLNDGAAATVMMSEARAGELGLKPLARVVAYADGEQAPIDFPTAPAVSIEKALKKANLSVADIDFWEINEAFSCVVLANKTMLNIDADKINVNGGAVSLGHPIGASGTRIVTTLAHILDASDKKNALGVASICNGGGGATTVILERC